MKPLDPCYCRAPHGCELATSSDRRFLPQIAVRHDVGRRWYDDSGVLNIGIIDFLLDDSLFFEPSRVRPALEGPYLRSVGKGPGRDRPGPFEV